MDEEDASERVKDRLEQAERAVEKFVSRRLKAVQPGLQKVNSRHHHQPQALTAGVFDENTMHVLSIERAHRLKAVQPGLQKVNRYPH